MLQNTPALLSPIPSAFTALGVGTVSALGPLTLALTTQKSGLTPRFSLGLLSDPNIPEHVKSALPILLGFASIFVVYTFGLVFIHTGTEMRRRIWRNLDSQRVAYVLNSDNEALQRLFFETRTSVSAMDGIALALSSFFIAFSIVLSAHISWWFSICGVVFGILICWVFWRQSERYLISFDDIARRIEKYRT